MNSTGLDDGRLDARETHLAVFFAKSDLIQVKNNRIQPRTDVNNQQRLQASRSSRRASRCCFVAIYEFNELEKVGIAI